MAVSNDGIVSDRIGRSDHNFVDPPGTAQTADDPGQNSFASQIHQHFARQASATHSSLDNSGDLHYSSPAGVIAGDYLSKCARTLPSARATSSISPSAMP